MSISKFVSVLLRNWWIVVLAVVITAGSTFFFVSRQPSVYVAQGTVELRPSTALNEGQMISLINVLNSKRTSVNNLARKATTEAIELEVAKKLGYDVAVINGAEVTSIALPETNLVQLRARSTDPQVAANIVNTIGQVLIEQNTEKVFQVVLIDPASAPTSASEPQVQRTVLLGAASGLALGIVLALLENVLRTVLAARRKQDVNVAAGKGNTVGQTAR